MRQIAEKTLLVGLGSTVFRDAKYTSHEVTIDDGVLHAPEETKKHATKCRTKFCAPFAMEQ